MTSLPDRSDFEQPAPGQQKSTMRARLQVDEALSDFSHRENGAAPADIARIEEIPA